MHSHIQYCNNTPQSRKNTPPKTSTAVQIDADEPERQSFRPGDVIAANKFNALLMEETTPTDEAVGGCAPDPYTYMIMVRACGTDVQTVFRMLEEAQVTMLHI
jgi:hypothetical protein